MEKILNFYEFNEKVNWNKASNYLAIASIALALGIKTLGKNENTLRFLAHKKIQQFDDYENIDVINKAKQSVISKVIRNKNILNKSDLINRINNVIVKENTKDDESLMYYIHFNDIDYIVVCKSNYEYNSFVHELNHLVDHRKITKEEIDIQSIIIDCTDTEQRYIDFFNEYMPKLSNRDHVKIAALSYEFFLKKKDYLLSDKEVYARVSNMRNVLIEEGFLKKEDTLKKSHILDFLNNLSKREIDIDEYSYIFDKYDFLIILPFIDIEQDEKLDMISSIKDLKDFQKYT